MASSLPQWWNDVGVQVFAGVGVGLCLLAAARRARSAVAWFAGLRAAARDLPHQRARVADLEAQLEHATADSAELRKLLGLPAPSSAKVIAAVSNQDLAALQAGAAAAGLWPGSVVNIAPPPSSDAGTGKAGG